MAASPLSTLFQLGGHPVTFFVDVSNLASLDVQRLFEQIQTSGGCISIYEASTIVLVKCGTRAALDHSERLGTKVLLDVNWVQDCIDHKRYLGADEGWGGHCIAQGHEYINGPSATSQPTDITQDGTRADSQSTSKRPAMGSYSGSTGLTITQGSTLGHGIPHFSPTDPRRSHLFSDEDDECIIQHFKAQLKQYPEKLTHDIIQELAAQRPTHSAEEWRYRYEHNLVQFTPAIHGQDRDRFILSLENIGTRMY